VRILPLRSWRGLYHVHRSGCGSVRALRRMFTHDAQSVLTVVHVQERWHTIEARDLSREQGQHSHMLLVAAQLAARRLARWSGSSPGLLNALN
jgi:hypothetical protein